MTLGKTLVIGRRDASDDRVALGKLGDLVNEDDQDLQNDGGLEDSPPYPVCREP